MLNRLTSKNICMIVYNDFSTDARVRREAETLALYGNKVTVLSLLENSSPKIYQVNCITVRQLNVKKYRGKSRVRYVLSYIEFLFFATIVCTNLFLKGQVDIIHVHTSEDTLQTLKRVVEIGWINDVDGLPSF